MFGGDIVGTEGKNELYGMCCTYKAHSNKLTYLLEYTMRFSPDSPIGVMQDW